MESCNCTSPSIGPSLSYTCGGGTFILFMSLLESYLRNQCDVEDPCGRIRPMEGQLKFTYDFVVIGSGSGGSVVASRLSEEPDWNVLLLEAGGDEPTGTQVPSMVINYHGSSIDWNYKTEPEKHACLSNPDHRCDWTRGKVLGGCTVLNGMMYIRGNPRDYDKWAERGNTGWSYQDVLPYFKKSEDNRQPEVADMHFHGEGGLLTVQNFPHKPEMADEILRAAQELGYDINPDLNGANVTGFSVAQTANRNGVRLSNARAFLRPARDRSNLDISLNSTATRIIFDKTKRATGVEFMKNGRKYTAYVRKEVILSAGAVNSPQLLMLSGVGPKKDLDRVGIPIVHELPGVGQNLHNHVAYALNFHTKNPAKHELDWSTAMDYMLYKNGPMSSTGLSQMTGIVNSKFADPKGDHPDMQFFFYGNLANCAKTGAVDEPVNPKNSEEYEAVGISSVVLHPRSRGFLTLGSKDPLAPPKIYANYLTQKRDVDTLVEAVKLAKRLSETKALKDDNGWRLLNPENKECLKNGRVKYGSDEYWACEVMYDTGPENHQAGSCRMGPVGDSMAVVDPELRVNGVLGVRVMDASVMPEVVSGNTNAPTTMIAEKGSDMIKHTWKRDADNFDLGSRFNIDDNNSSSNDSVQNPAQNPASQQQRPCRNPPCSYYGLDFPGHHHHHPYDHSYFMNMPNRHTGQYAAGNKPGIVAVGVIVRPDQANNQNKRHPDLYWSGDERNP